MYFTVFRKMLSVEIRAPFIVGHLFDEMVDFPHHVLEGSLQLPLDRHFAVERLHDGENVAVEGDRRSLTWF